MVVGGRHINTHPTHTPNMEICNANKANGERCTHRARFNGRCGYHRVREPVRVVLPARDVPAAPALPLPAAAAAMAELAALIERVRVEALEWEEMDAALAAPAAQAAPAAPAAPRRRRVAAPRRRRVAAPAAPAVVPEALAPPAAPAAPRRRQRAVPVRPRLQVLANDLQNVHTAEANAQTKQGESVLRGVVYLPDYQYLGNIGMAFYQHVMAMPAVPDRSITLRKIPRVMEDITQWYDTPTCRRDGDYLYRTLLRQAWTLIDASPHRTELVRRLWEEGLDGVHMCCQGHIGRLINVFVGIDERFDPPVAKGETLQNRMAAIAARDMDPEAAREAARGVLRELAVPEGEWAPWLEAF